MDILALFTPSLLLQSLTVGIIVYMFRLWFESRFNQLKTNKLWTGLYLPTLAITVSVGISLVLPSGALLIEKIQTGILAGFSSGYLFSALKAILNKQAGNDNE